MSTWAVFAKVFLAFAPIVASDSDVCAQSCDHTSVLQAKIEKNAKIGPKLVCNNKYCVGPRKAMGGSNGFFHTLESCSEAVLSDPDCMSGRFDFNEEYKGQCKCALGECKFYNELGGYSVYQAGSTRPVLVASNKYCGSDRKPMGGGEGFGHSLENCSDAVVNDPDCASKRFDFNEGYKGQCKCATGDCSSFNSASGYSVYQAPSSSAITLVATNKYCGDDRKPIGGGNGFMYTLENCSDAVLKDPDCTSKRFDFDKDYHGQCKCSLGECNVAMKSLSGYNVYEAPALECPVEAPIEAPAPPEDAPEFTDIQFSHSGYWNNFKVLQAPYGNKGELDKDGCNAKCNEFNCAGFNLKPVGGDKYRCFIYDTLGGAIKNDGSFAYVK